MAPSNWRSAVGPRHPHGGTLGTPIAYDSGGANPVGVGVLDLNADGKLDVVVANSGFDPQGTRTMPSNVATLLNSGAGKLMAATVAYTAIYPISVAAAIP